MSKKRRMKLKKEFFDEDKIKANQFAGGHQLLRSFLLLSPFLGGSPSSLFGIVKVLFDQDRLNKIPSILHYNESVSKGNELTSSGLESLPLYSSLCFWLFVP